MDVKLVEVPQPDSPYGIKGVGEIGLVPTAGAVAAALQDFDGTWRSELPMRNDANRERPWGVNGQRIRRQRLRPRARAPPNPPPSEVPPRVLASVRAALPVALRRPRNGRLRRPPASRPTRVADDLPAGVLS